MSWWLLALVGAILVSTLHKLLPRGRDLHLGRLRERARQLGFRVELQRTQASAHMPPGMLAYRLALPRIRSEEGFAFERSEGGWKQLSGQAPVARIQAVLDALPAEVRLLERDTHFAVVFWQEPNKVEALERLHEVLQPLSDKPVGTNDLL